MSDDLCALLRASIAREHAKRGPTLHVVREPCARCRALEGRARPAVCSACRLSEADRALMNRAIAAGEAMQNMHASAYEVDDG